MKHQVQLLENRANSLTRSFIRLYKKLAAFLPTKKTIMLITDLQDEHGMIRVIEVGDYRFLEFGMRIEQSCVFMQDPAWLEYDYTRAMLMGALAHNNPKSALFLGLGAGTLTNACLKYLPLHKATAIELRQHVIDIAKTHLNLTDDLRLSILQGDALARLYEQPNADLIFLDLYTDTGPSEGHSAWDFLGACRDKLNPNGWLIINQWATQEGTPLEAPTLKARFQKHYWECSVESGNVVLFIPQNKTQQLDLELLKQQIESLEPELGYSLYSLLNKIKLTPQQ